MSPKNQCIVNIPGTLFNFVCLIAQHILLEQGGNKARQILKTVKVINIVQKLATKKVVRTLN